MRKITALLITLQTALLTADFSAACRPGTLLVDPYFSPYMGASDILFGHALTESSVNVLIPHNRVKNHPNLSQFGRLGELTVYWFFNQFLTTVQHEVFGHGYRLRSLGRREDIHVRRYYFSLLGGATEFFANPSKMSTGEASALVAGGTEAEEILAQMVKTQWFQEDT